MVGVVPSIVGVVPRIVEVVPSIVGVRAQHAGWIAQEAMGTSAVEGSKESGRGAKVPFIWKPAPRDSSRDVVLDLKPHRGGRGSWDRGPAGDGRVNIGEGTRLIHLTHPNQDWVLGPS